MKTLSIVAVLMAVMVGLVSPVVGDETSKALAMADKAKGALAMVSVTVTNDLDASKEQSFAGPAFCVNAKKRILVTLIINPNLSPERIKSIETITVGIDRKKLKSELVGIDTGTGLSFIKVLDESEWTEVQFAPSSNLKTGDMVTSIGLMTNVATFPPYVGTAYVSAQMRIPDHLVRVTGGTLTGRCSPVFNSAGRAIGIVGRQVPESWQMQGQRGYTKVPVMGDTASRYFWPVEEFVHVWRNMPKNGKASRRSWFGVANFGDGKEDVLKALGLGDTPLVRVEKVIPGFSAAEAGLKEGDYITGVNGKGLEKLGTAALTRMHFVKSLLRAKAGVKFELTVRRDSSERTISVTTTEQPLGTGSAPRYVNKGIGLLVRERVAIEKLVNPELHDDGVVVLATAQSSAAAAAGLKPGDVIYLVEGQKSKHAGIFTQLLEKALRDTSKCKMQIHRGTGDHEIIVRVIGVVPGKGQ